MTKIALFADGTGNARSDQFRTNVWKLYDALQDEPDSGQLGFYHDGVGTSAFAPLKLLGGVFGIGLGRNIRQIYAFLCRNYSSLEDEIFLFGFSRGAFTARILAGLIAHQGVRQIKDEAELARWVDQAYRANRLRIVLLQVGFFRGALFRIVGRIRDRLRDNRPFTEEQTYPDIKLVGVWDTVAAYGGPIVEMVRGFDRWVWPLSMPDYTLSPKVLAGRHALSLDEEREAFLPLLWDEMNSPPNRIRQVWFAGVHSDVGGGYADEGLSGNTLAWMLAEAKHVGLSFKTAAEKTIAASLNALGPMHDSRSGVGVIYRYQPRSINALMGLTPNSPLRDPESGNQPMIKQAVVHQSVLVRIKDPDGYAPIVLPTTFEDENGTGYQLPSACRQEIWALVRRRRTLQWSVLVIGAVALLSPKLPKPLAVEFVDQLLAVPLGAALTAVPLMPTGLKAAYAATGTWLLVCAALILFLLGQGNRNRMKITKASAAMWADRTPVPEGIVAPPAQSRSGRLLDWQRAWQRLLKWRIAPAFFGLGLYAFAVFASALFVSQIFLFIREADRGLCVDGVNAGPIFAVSENCHQVGKTPLTRGLVYKVKITVMRGWKDGDPDGIMASPLGFGTIDVFSTQWNAGHYTRAISRLAAFLMGTTIRREPFAEWFVPVIAIRAPGSRWLFKIPLSMIKGDDGAFRGRFTSPADGNAFIYVNDAIAPTSNAKDYYSNNQGNACVEITSDQ